MTHTRQMSDSEGEFNPWRDTERRCERAVEGKPCGESMKVRTWESSDGAFEDYQYRCAVGHVMWIDGIDS
jgi:hypothetical protein